MAVLAGLREVDVEVVDVLAVVDMEGRMKMMVDMSIVITGMPWTTIHCYRTFCVPLSEETQTHLPLVVRMSEQCDSDFFFGN